MEFKTQVLVLFKESLFILKTSIILVLHLLKVAVLMTDKS